MSAQGFFNPGEYASLPKELLADQKIGLAAKILYLGLQSYLDTEKVKAWPGPADLAKKTGLCRRTIQMGVDKLHDAGWIYKDSKGGPNGQNLYTVYARRTKSTSAPDALPLAHELPQVSAPDAPKEHHRRTPLRNPKSDGDSLALPTVLDTPGFREVWGKWVQYRKERRKALTSSTAEAQLRKLSEVGPDRASKMIQQSIEQGWQGIFPLKDQTRDTQPKERTPRDYSNGF